MIEKQWTDLMKAVHGRQPRNLVDLAQLCQEEWAEITSGRIQTLLRGNPKKLDEVTKIGQTMY